MTMAIDDENPPMTFAVFLMILGLVFFGVVTFLIWKLLF